jgi:hypothetical protein
MRFEVAGILCFVAGAGSALAGVVVHVSKTDSDAPARQEVLYAQDGLLRVDEVDDKGQVRDSTLIRDGAIWKVDPQKRTFTRIDKSAVSSKAGEMEQRIQAAMANMPPEKRAMIEQRMKAMQQQPHDFELTDAGRSEHVGSYTCQVWQATRDGKPMTEYCIAPRGSIAGGDELVAATHKAAAIASEVMSGAPGMTRGALSPTYKLYARMDGFPVSTRHVMGAQTSEESKVTSIEKKSLAADQFAIPKGYTEATLARPDPDDD